MHSLTWKTLKCHQHISNIDDKDDNLIPPRPQQAIGRVMCTFNFYNQPSPCVHGGGRWWWVNPSQVIVTGPATTISYLDTYVKLKPVLEIWVPRMTHPGQAAPARWQNKRLDFKTFVSIILRGRKQTWWRSGKLRENVSTAGWDHARKQSEYWYKLLFTAVFANLIPFFQNCHIT